MFLKNHKKQQTRWLSIVVGAASLCLTLSVSVLSAGSEMAFPELQESEREDHRQNKDHDNEYPPIRQPDEQEQEGKGAEDEGKPAKQGASLQGVKRVLHCDSDVYAHQLAENVAPLVARVADGYSHLLAPATAAGKNLMPRVAAVSGLRSSHSLDRIAWGVKKLPSREIAIGLR